MAKLGPRMHAYWLNNGLLLPYTREKLLLECIGGIHAAADSSTPACGQCPLIGQVKVECSKISVGRPHQRALLHNFACVGPIRLGFSSLQQLQITIAHHDGT